MKRLVCGIDPGSGSSSPTAIAIFDPDSRTILHVSEVWPKAKEQSKRLREIGDAVFGLLAAVDPEVELYVFVESFFIRGRGNQILQQVIGAIKAAVPERAHLADVPNTTMKLVVAGAGTADKLAVALAVGSYFGESVIHLGSDVTDALGIGVAGWLKQNEKRSNEAASHARGQNSTSPARRTARSSSRSKTTTSSPKASKSNKPS